MSEQQIKEHWPIFEPWYKSTHNCGYLPVGAALVAAWYEYCAAYNAMLDSHQPLTEPDISDAPDD